MSTFYNPEKTQLNIGFVPLLDCAPLVVAREQGFFQQEGLQVILSRETNWASIRDKVSYGVLDAAHMLSPMPLAATLGLRTQATPVQTALVLSTNGNAVTLSNALMAELGENRPAFSDPLDLGRCLKTAIARGRRRPTLATVFPYSSHHYQLRYWLNCCGLDADHDVQLIAVPPPRMLEQLRRKEIDGYCVGEPWNTLAELEGIGRIAVTGYQIWQNSVEKVLGVTREWADQHPQTHRALVRALLQACRWLADPAHSQAFFELCGLPPYLDLVGAPLMKSMYEKHLGKAPLWQQFYGKNTNFPWLSHGHWIQEQMRRSGQTEAITDPQMIKDIYRTDIYREVASGLYIPCPTSNTRKLGETRLSPFESTSLLGGESYHPKVA